MATSDPSLRKPVNRGVARRSLPIPDIADRLLARARDLEAQGKRSEALKAYQAAMTAVRRAEQDQARAQERKATEKPRQVAALKITARRGNPEEQRASLKYDRPGNAPEMPEIQSGASLTGAGSGSGTSVGPQVGAGGTAISGGAALGNSGVRASTNASAQKRNPCW